MTKYLSKEGLNLYDSLIKDYFDDKVQNVLDLVAYGVEWDINIADPYLTRIGNLSFHKTSHNTYDQGINKLKVPTGAIGYDTSYWLDPLQNSDKCGFTIEYI